MIEDDISVSLFKFNARAKTIVINRTNQDFNLTLLFATYTFFAPPQPTYSFISNKVSTILHICFSEYLILHRLNSLIMPGKQKKKKGGRQGGGSHTKVAASVVVRNVKNEMKTSSAGDFETDVPCEDSVADKLNEAQLLDDSTEVVILSRSDNDTKNNNESKTSSIVTLDSGYADQSITSETSVQKVEESFNDPETSSSSFNDSKGSVGIGNRDPFEVSFSGAINNNAAKNKDKSRSTTSSGRKEVTSVASGGGLKTTEDYINLGVDPVYAVMKHPLENAWTFWYIRHILVSHRNRICVSGTSWAILSSTSEIKADQKPRLGICARETSPLSTQSKISGRSLITSRGQAGLTLAVTTASSRQVMLLHLYFFLLSNFAERY